MRGQRYTYSSVLFRIICRCPELSRASEVVPALVQKLTCLMATVKAQSWTLVERAALVYQSCRLGLTNLLPTVRG